MNRNRGSASTRSHVSRFTCSQRRKLTRHSTLRNQQVSPLLRLPGELRKSIYEYALGGHVLCLKYEASVQRHGSKITVWGTEGVNRPQPCSIAVLRACRQLHLETKRLPFSLNVFQGSIEDFLIGIRDHFSQHEHASAIRSVRVLLDSTDLFWTSGWYDLEAPADETFTEPLDDILSGLRALEGLKEIHLQCMFESIWKPEEASQMKGMIAREARRHFESDDKADHVEIKVSYEGEAGRHGRNPEAK